MRLQPLLAAFALSISLVAPARADLFGLFSTEAEAIPVLGSPTVGWQFEEDGKAPVTHRLFDPYLDTAPFANRGFKGEASAAGGVCFGMSLELIRHFRLATLGSSAGHGEDGKPGPVNDAIRLRNWLTRNPEATHSAYWQRVVAAQDDQSAGAGRSGSKAERKAAERTLGGRGQELLESWFGAGLKSASAPEVTGRLGRDVSQEDRGLGLLGYTFYDAQRDDTGAHAVTIYKVRTGRATDGTRSYPAQAFYFYDSNNPAASRVEAARWESSQMVLAIQTDEGVKLSFAAPYLEQLAGFGWFPQVAVGTKVGGVATYTDTGEFLNPQQLMVAPVFERYYERWINEYRGEKGRLPRRGIAD